MDDAFIGEIRCFAGNFAPVGWEFCRGQTMDIQQNAALFSILGVTYGGNGQTNFNLPDLRGRTPIGFAQGPGLSFYQLGDTVGVEKNTLYEENLPPHSHAAQGSINASSNDGTTSNPSGAFPAKSIYPKDRCTTDNVNSYSSGAGTKMADNAVQIQIGNTGSALPVNNMQPSLAVNWIICVNGIYPSRQ